MAHNSDHNDKVCNMKDFITQDQQNHNFHISNTIITEKSDQI